MVRRLEYARGILDAQVALAEIVGPMKLDKMSEEAWEITVSLNIKFCELALKALDDKNGD